MAHYDIVIVGAGHGGAQAAIALRMAGFEGSDADDRPRCRGRPTNARRCRRNISPAKSRSSGIMIRPVQFWADKGVELRLGDDGDRSQPRRA